MIATHPAPAAAHQAQLRARRTMPTVLLLAASLLALSACTPSAPQGSPTPDPPGSAIEQVTVTWVGGFGAPSTDEWSTDDPAITAQLGDLLTEFDVVGEDLDLAPTHCDDAGLTTIEYTIAGTVAAISFDGCHGDTRDDALEAALVALVDEWNSDLAGDA